MQAILLHNPNAGTGDFPADDLLAALAQGGVRASHCSAKSQDFPDALNARIDLVVIAGGDGTVVKAISHLRDRFVPVAILPLGNANNIAGSLGIEGDATAIARAGWQRTETRRLDIGTVNGPRGTRTFVEGVGVGVLAEAMAAIAGQGAQGADRSRRARNAICEMLTHAEQHEAAFVVDGQSVQVSLLFAEIMNIRSMGPRLLLAPDARPGDGLLDFVYLEPDQRAAMLSWLESSSESAPPLKSRKAREVSFMWRSGGLHIDDDFLSPPEHGNLVEIRLSPDPITVLMPASLGFREAGDQAETGAIGGYI